MLSFSLWLQDGGSNLRGAFCLLSNNAETLKLKTAHSLYILVTVYQSTWHHIPEGNDFYCLCCENLPFYVCHTVKVMLFLCVVNHHTMKTRGEV